MIARPKLVRTHPAPGGEPPPVDIVFLALARNCAPTVAPFLGLLAELRAAGLRCLAHVGENGSRDGTDRLLDAAARKGDICLAPTGFLADVPGRLHRMALGRQHLKALFDVSGVRAGYVCVLDLDNVMRDPPSVAAIRRAMTKLERPDLFAVSATSHPHYYDLLAYEDSARSFEFLVERFTAHQTDILSYHRFFRTDIYPHQKALTSRSEILCTSAFNGMSIYRSQAYALGSYVGDGFRRCEHLTFNRQVAEKTGARMLIDPGLVLTTPDDHAEKTLVPFAWQRVKKRFARYG